jgi:glutathione S-transferase
MTEPILHHYPNSPFAEKIRLVLGYKQLAWRSVRIPIVMPKPDLVALTGGYRKTPVLQLGADIYCDTALICDVLEHLRPEPALYPAHDKGMARILAQWSDTTLFWTAMAYCLTPKGMAQMFDKAGPEAARAFGADRAAMRVATPRIRPGDAAGAYRSYLRRLADMLETREFLLGAQPCVADFATYHALWFTRTQTPVMADVFEATPAVPAWLDRMAAIGHGTSTRLSAEDAIAQAAHATPLPVADAVFQDDHGIALGTQVSIAGNDFGPEATTGELVAATRMHYTLRRVDARAGTVHVHFPRIGYVLRPAEGA